MGIVKYLGNLCSSAVVIAVYLEYCRRSYAPPLYKHSFVSGGILTPLSTLGNKKGRARALVGKVGAEKISQEKKGNGSW